MGKPIKKKILVESKPLLSIIVEGPRQTQLGGRNPKTFRADTEAAVKPDSPT